MSPVKTECVIVGAGPCGLFCVFELGLLGIGAHVIESRDEPGGQCSALYPDKPIYDIPALPVVRARELVERLLEQIRPFQAPIHLGHEVTTVQPCGGRFRLCTSGGLEVDAGTVIIAGGIGSFQPRPLRLAQAAKHEGLRLHYHVADKSRFAGEHVVILGGGDSAVDWAVELFDVAASITVVHRREQFRAAPATVAQMQANAEAHPNRMRWLVAKVVELVERDGSLCAIRVASFDDERVETIPLDSLLVFYGISPKLGPIADWGIAIEKRQLQVDPETQQTNIPGIFAIGDINTYPSKKKLILTGFYEATIAAYAVQKHLYPEQKQSVQYTTTSSALQQRLGVKNPPK